MNINYIKDKKIGCLKELEKEIGYDELTKLITLNYITTKTILSKGIYLWIITDNCKRLSVKEKFFLKIKRIYFENMHHIRHS